MATKDTQVSEAVKMLPYMGKKDFAEIIKVKDLWNGEIILDCVDWAI